MNDEFKVGNVMRESKVADYWITESILLDLLISDKLRGWFKVELSGIGLPIDAQFLGIHYDYCRRAFLVRFAHESFCLVPEGDVVPIVGEVLLNFKTETTNDDPVVIEDK